MTEQGWKSGEASGPTMSFLSVNLVSKFSPEAEAGRELPSLHNPSPDWPYEIPHSLVSQIALCFHLLRSSVSIYCATVLPAM